MRFSTTFRYGVRAVMQLAATQPSRAVSVREIGQMQNISPKYLEHILPILKAGGLIDVVRGKRGGYVLAKSPDRITLKELHEKLVGAFMPSHCVADAATCPMRNVCPVWDTWVEIKGALDGVMEGTTVQTLLDRANEKRTAIPA